MELDYDNLSKKELIKIIEKYRRFLKEIIHVSDSDIPENFKMEWETDIWVYRTGAMCGLARYALGEYVWGGDE